MTLPPLASKVSMVRGQSHSGEHHQSFPLRCSLCGFSFSRILCVCVCLFLCDSEANSMLASAMELSFRYFGHDNYEVAAEIVPYMQRFVDILKTLGSALLTAEQLGHLHRMLALCAKQLRYPSTYNFDSREEDEAYFDDHRLTIQTLIKNIAKLAPTPSVQFIQQRFSHTLQQLGEFTMAEIEASLQLFYLLGEALPHPDFLQIIKSGPLADMMHALIVGDKGACRIARHEQGVAVAAAVQRHG